MKRSWEEGGVREILDGGQGLGELGEKRGQEQSAESLARSWSGEGRYAVN